MVTSRAGGHDSVHDRRRELWPSSDALGPGARDVPLDLIAVTPWTVYAQVADHFQSGNTFLVGDAAHRFPPTGGLRRDTPGSKTLITLPGSWPPSSKAGHENLFWVHTSPSAQPIGRRNAEQSLKNLQATEALDILTEASHSADGQRFSPPIPHAARRLPVPWSTNDPTSIRWHCNSATPTTVRLTPSRTSPILYPAPCPDGDFRTAGWS